MTEKPPNKNPCGDQVSQYPYSVTMGWDRELSRELWLLKNLGEQGDRWDILPVYRYQDPIIYAFKDQADCVEFTLRWL